MEPFEAWPRLGISDESTHVGDLPQETLQLLADRGGFHLSDGLGFDRIEMDSFSVVVNPKSFSEETLKAHFRGFICKLYCLHLKKTFLRSSLCDALPWTSQ